MPGAQMVRFQCLPHLPHFGGNSLALELASNLQRESGLVKNGAAVSERLQGLQLSVYEA